MLCKPGCGVDDILCRLREAYGPNLSHHELESRFRHCQV